MYRWIYILLGCIFNDLNATLFLFPVWDGYSSNIHTIFSINKKTDSLSNKEFSKLSTINMKFRQLYSCQIISSFSSKTRTSLKTQLLFSCFTNTLIFQPFPQWRNARWLGLEQVLRAPELWGSPRGPSRFSVSEVLVMPWIANCSKAALLSPRKHNAFTRLLDENFFLDDA